MNTKVQNCINGYRHKDYNHVVKLAHFYRTIVTGEDYAELIREYKSRETTEQKKQRVEITRVRTKSVAGKVEGFFKRPYRADKIKLKATHQDQEKAAKLAQYIDNYGQDGETMLSYCEETALFLNGIDPNALYWIKHTIKNGVDEFEPVIFDSKQVLDFNVKNGVLTYAVTHLQELVTVQKGKETQIRVIDIYYYFNENGIEISILKDAVVFDTMPMFYDPYFAANSIEEPILTKTNDKEYFTITIQDEKLDKTKLPICRIGYNKDKSTNGRTYVSYWDNASELYRMLVDDGSEFDITKILHVFMQKYEYEKTCDYQDGATKATCVNGKMHPTGTQCPSCNGTGGTTIISGQDVIKIRLPRVNEGETIAIKPADMVHYVQLPFEMVEFQKQLVDEYYPKITEAIFGIDLAKKNNEANTATEVVNYFDMAQDAIFEFTKAPTRMFLFTVQTQANYLQIDDVQAAIEYPNEYSLESEEHLLGLLQKAKEAGAYPEIIENITKRLALKQNRSDSGYMAIWEKMRQFMPFSGVDNETRQALLLSLSPTDPQRILAVNFKQITDEIINKQRGFALLPYDRQKKIIEDKTKEYVDAAIKANAVLTMSEIAKEEPLTEQEDLIEDEQENEQEDEGNATE